MSSNTGDKHNLLEKIKACFGRINSKIIGVFFAFATRHLILKQPISDVKSYSEDNIE